MLLRLFFRVMSLAAKFGLTVAVARTLGFTAVGEYGLTVAASVIASKVGGLGFSAELNRQLSGSSPNDAIATARGLRRVYAGFYAIAGLGVLTASLSGWLSGTSLSLESLCLMLLVAASEHYALEANTYVFSVHRPRTGSSMLFVRTGGWAIIAIAGLLSGALGDIRVVFVLWTLANLGVIGWAWMLLSRIAPSRMDATTRTERSTSTLRATWAGGVQFYVGGVLLAGLQYAERFVASAWLPSAEVGRYVFMWSVANAVQTIAYASVGVIAGPRLARAAGGSGAEWSNVFGKSFRSTVGVSIAVAIGIACASPLIFWLAKERSTPAALLTLSVLLLSFLLRSIGDLLWLAAVARRARRRIVVSMCIAAVISLPFSIWLIPGHAAIQIALAHLVASASVLMMLVWAHYGTRGASDNV